MRLSQISWSRWGDTDVDFAGIKVTNNQGQSSELMGMSRHSIQSITLKQESIQNIKVFRKDSDGYMRGFRITYRNGQTDLIGSDNGLEAGVVTFEESDVLVGFTLQCNSESDKRPRRFGFTKMSKSAPQQLMPNAAGGSAQAVAGAYIVHEIKPIGNEFRLA